MKRIQSLDIMRGIAMLGLVFFHAFEKVAHNSVIAPIFTYPWYIFFPLGILLYFASWRGFFLIISGAAGAFSFQKAVSNGKSPHLLLIRRILWSLVLFFHGILIQLFFNPYSGLYGVFQGGTAVLNISALQWSDAVQVIAVGVFMSSLIHYALCLGKLKNNPWISIGIFGILMVLIFLFTPFLNHYILNTYGWTSIGQIMYAPVANFRDRVRWLFLAVLVGEQEPMFPYLATFFLGSAIGIALTHSKLTKKRTLIIGFSLGFVIMIASLILGIYEGFIVGISIIPTLWFLILSTGIQVWVLTGFLWIFDFSRKAEKLTRYTKTIRKAGILSLTIFTLQSLDYFPRLATQKLSQLWGSSVDYISNSGWIPIGDAFLVSFIVLIFWLILISLWGTINYTLSIDWLFEIFRNFSSGQKIYWRDPLRSRDIIQRAEIVFQQSENKREMV